MTELEIEELERKVTVSDSVIAAEARSVEVLPDQVGKDVRNVLPEMGAEEQTDSLDAEEVAIVMEIAEVIERARKDKRVSLHIQCKCGKIQTEKTPYWDTFHAVTSS